MKMPRSWLIKAGVLLVFLAFLGWWSFMSGHVFHSHASNAPNRQALLDIYTTVAFGSSPDEVRTVFLKRATPKLRLIANDAKSWIVLMPIEWGATDWKLIIEFQEGKVAALRVRMADGPPPKDGPKDRGI